MLTTLAIIYLFSGGLDPLFDKATRAAVQQAITDEVRQDEVVAAIDDIEETWKQTNKSLKKPSDSLARLEADRTTTAGEFQTAVAEMISIRDEFDRAFIDTIFEMRESMTDEEWRAVFGDGS